jgi:excinuclease ABC subunit A
VVAEGSPEDVAANPESYTGHFLAQTLGLPRPMRKPRNGRNGRNGRKVSA